MRMFEQQHRLERKLAGRDVAELLAIPALDGLRPSFWGHCVIATVRSFTHDGTAREIGPEHLPPLPRGTDRAEPVLTWARQLWALMRDPAGAVPLEHDAYLKMWHLEGARLPDWAAVLYVDEAQDADPVTLAILQAQRRPTVWVGDPWQSIYRFRGSVNAMRAIDAPQRPLTRSWRFGEELARVARGILAHTSEPPALALRGDPGIATMLGPVRPPCAVLCRTNAGLFEAAVRGRDRIHMVGGVEPLARLVLGGWRLRQGEPVPEVPSLARFRSWDELVEEAEEARDPELRFLVQVVAHYGRALPALVADLRRRAVAHPAHGGAGAVDGAQGQGPGVGAGAARRGLPGPRRAARGWTGTGCPISRPRSATRSCTCSTWPRPVPGASSSPTTRSGAASPRGRDRSRCTARIGSCFRLKEEGSSIGRCRANTWRASLLLTWRRVPIGLPQSRFSRSRTPLPITCCRARAEPLILHGLPDPVAQPK